MRGHSSSAREEWPALLRLMRFLEFFLSPGSFSPKENKSRSLSPIRQRRAAGADNLYSLYSFGQLKIGPV